MMSRYRGYPKYKDSGIEWLRSIPAHWDVRRLKTIASVQLSNVDKKSAEGQEPVRLCNYTDVYYNDRITDDLDFMRATATREQIRRFTLAQSDVLITKDSESWTDIAVPALVADDLPGVLCGYHLAHIRPGSECHGPYLARAFSAIGPRDQFQLAANGITRFGLVGDSIRDGQMPVPPKPEQLAIAAFLDRETARIDALVAKKERLIELLHEKRTALVSHAVTKGLDRRVPLKDSRVEWLGQVPVSWECLALSRVTFSRCDGPFGSGLKSEHYATSGVRVVRLQNIGWTDFRDVDRAYVDKAYASQLGDHSVVGDDLLIAGLGDDQHPVGRACVAPHDIAPAMVKADCFRFRLDQRRAIPRFVAYQLSASALATAGSESTGATRARMNLTATSRRGVALPPLSEQHAIVEMLERDRVQCANLVNRIRNGIERLKELRIATVSAAVTGAIDVREEAT
jgi:type I restriction enzyme S subunit